MSKKITFTDEQIAQIKEMYENGESTEVMWRKMGFNSVKPIYNAIKEYNLVRPENYKANKIDIDNNLILEIKENFSKDKIKFIKVGKFKILKIDFSEKQKEILKKCFENDISPNKISELSDFNVSKTPLELIYPKIMGTPYVTSHKKHSSLLNEDEYKQITKLFNDGYGAQTISQKLNIKMDYIKKAFNKLGLKRKPGPVAGVWKVIPTERVCRECNVLKLINNFDSGFKNKEIVYEYYCKICLPLVRSRRLKERNETEPHFKIRQIISKFVHSALVNRNSSKNGDSSWKKLGYTPQELADHLEKQFADNLDINGNVWMKWSNYGSYRVETWDDNDTTTWKWNLDHIIPDSEFIYETMDDEGFKQAWSLSNLRPYSAKQNQLDGVRRTRHVSRYGQSAKSLSKIDNSAVATASLDLLETDNVISDV